MQCNFGSKLQSRPKFALHVGHVGLLLINNSLHLARKLLGYLSADIICSEKQTVYRERSSRETVSFEEQIMSKDEYPSTFSKLNGGYCVYYSSHFRTPENIFNNLIRRPTHCKEQLRTKRKVNQTQHEHESTGMFFFYSSKNRGIKIILDNVAIRRSLSQDHDFPRSKVLDKLINEVAKLTRSAQWNVKNSFFVEIL